jgi:hypothetical protein
MTAPVRVKLSLPSFGRGLGLEWSVLAWGSPTRGALWVPVSPPSRRICHPVPTPFHNTARASIKLRQIGSSSPAPPFAFLTKPSLPTTTHSTLPLAPASSFSGTRTLELSFGSLLRLSCFTQRVFNSLSPRSIQISLQPQPASIALPFKLQS